METDGYIQLASYVFNTRANVAVWFNSSVRYYRRLNTSQD